MDNDFNSELFGAAEADAEKAEKAEEAAQETEVQTEEAAEAVNSIPEEKANADFGSASQFQSFQQPQYGSPAHQQPQYSAPYQNGNANPYSAGNTYGRQPSYNQTNQQFNPYSQTASNYGQMPAGNNVYSPANVAAAQQPKKKKTGIIVFVIIICLCFVGAIVALCASIAGNGTSSDPSKPSPGKPEQTNEDAPKPKAEDSPISFEEYSGKGSMTPEQIYDAVKDINVGILVYSQNQLVGEGSGIIVGEDKDGKNTYIITCAHVINDKGVSIQVKFIDETEIDAVVVGYDTKTDVGVLKVNKTGFKAATFGNSDSLSVGQKIYAIGNPGGTEFFGSFTGGMISAIDRPIANTNTTYDLPCIQHNAAINPGNSGGALVNEFGQVIGLNSSKIADTDYEGMGFSVPSNTMLEIYNELVEHGYVTNRPMLGINYYAVSSDYTYAAIAWKNNLPYGSIVIANIGEMSDLANSSVKVGDIVIAVNGKKLETTDILLEAIEKGSVGDTITLTICRLNNNGSVNSMFDVKVKLVEDNGTAIYEQEEEPVTQDPFSEYFGNFGGFGY